MCVSVCFDYVEVIVFMNIIFLITICVTILSVCLEMWLETIVFFYFCVRFINLLNKRLIKMTIRNLETTWYISLVSSARNSLGYNSVKYTLISVT